mmetsp:Transcript_144421/g.462753  ORF Transcript_144421/g.462753 Transcript_144421/m.462753 type:complete len:120 (+) Transcript_144421:191-550(+)
MELCIQACGSATKDMATESLFTRMARSTRAIGLAIASRARADFSMAQGRFDWPDGRVYVGEYVDDIKEGVGVLTWPDGQQYDGQWKAGRQHGVAVYIRNGASRKGEWREGKRSRWLPDA